VLLLLELLTDPVLALQYIAARNNIAVDLHGDLFDNPHLLRERNGGHEYYYSPSKHDLLF
jgi:hypothetical protein